MLLVVQWGNTTRTSVRSTSTNWCCYKLINWSGCILLLLLIWIIHIMRFVCLYLCIWYYMSYPLVNIYMKQA